RRRFDAFRSSPRPRFARGNRLAGPCGPVTPCRCFKVTLSRTEEIPMTDVSGSISTAEVRAFIIRCHEALTQQSRGHPESLLELWSRADDVSVMAAVGGYQVGFDAVSDLLAAASKTQSFDSWSAENLVTYVVDELAFSVELEHYGRAVDGEDQGM